MRPGHLPYWQPTLTSKARTEHPAGFFMLLRVDQRRALVHYAQRTTSLHMHKTQNIPLSADSIVVGRVHSLPTLLTEGFIRTVIGGGTIRWIRFKLDAQRAIAAGKHKPEMTGITEGRLLRGEEVVIVASETGDRALWWGRKSEYDAALAEIKRRRASEAMEGKRPPIHATRPGHGGTRLILK